MYTPFKVKRKIVITVETVVDLESPGDTVLSVKEKGVEQRALAAARLAVPIETIVRQIETMSAQRPGTVLVISSKGVDVAPA